VTVRDFFALATCYAGSTGRNRPEADCRLRPVLMRTNLLEKFMRFGTAAFALLLTHGLAAAGGYHGWEFGMTQAQIRAVGDQPAITRLRTVTSALVTCLSKMARH